MFSLSHQIFDWSCLISFFIYIVENTSELYKELLENEKKNFQLVRSAVRDLGGIPAMINHSDMSNTIPDEKVRVSQLITRVSEGDSKMHILCQTSVFISSVFS